MDPFRELSGLDLNFYVFPVEKSLFFVKEEFSKDGAESAIELNTRLIGVLMMKLMSNLQASSEDSLDAYADLFRAYYLLGTLASGERSKIQREYLKNPKTTEIPQDKSFKKIIANGIAYCPSPIDDTLHVFLESLSLVDE
ncbi:MAG: hypothetical protein V3T99_00380 [Nitrososphaerales archaeon]